MESLLAFPANFVPEAMSHMYPSSSKKETNFWDPIWPLSGDVEFLDDLFHWRWNRRRLGGPRQCLRVDILPDVLQFAISNGNGEDPIVLERFIRGH